VSAHSPSGSGTGWDSGTVLLRPCTLAGAPPGRPPGRGRGAVAPGAQLHQRAGRGRVVGEAAAAEDDVGARALVRRTLELGPP
jgi:hypothetical protein